MYNLNSTDQEILDEETLDLVQCSNHYIFNRIVKHMINMVGRNEDVLILIQVLATLKIDGVLNDEFNEDDFFLVKVIKDTICNSPQKKQAALNYVKNLIETQSIKNKLG